MDPRLGHTCNIALGEGRGPLRQEDYWFWVTLGYITRPCLKEKEGGNEARTVLRWVVATVSIETEEPLCRVLS